MLEAIVCLNSKCVNYYEELCMKFFETGSGKITADGTCAFFEPGKHVGYDEDSEEESAEKDPTCFIKETKTKNAEILECGGLDNYEDCKKCEFYRENFSESVED